MVIGFTIINYYCKDLHSISAAIPPSQQQNKIQDIESITLH